MLNYLKRIEGHGTGSNRSRWQIHMFRFGLLWISLCVAFIIATLGLVLS